MTPLSVMFQKTNINPSPQEVSAKNKIPGCRTTQRKLLYTVAGVSLLQQDQ
jgi:hypothetical protein